MQLDVGAVGHGAAVGMAEDGWLLRWCWPTLAQPRHSEVAQPGWPPCLAVRDCGQALLPY